MTQPRAQAGPAVAAATEAVEAVVRRNGWDAEEDLDGARTLVLQRNGLEVLGDALRPFRGLVKLDLSRNKLVSLEGLEHLEQLETLNIYLNKINDGRQLLLLRRNTELRKLDARLNPLVRSRLYRSFVIQQLEDLSTLDEQLITALERRKAAQLPPIAPGDLRPNLHDDDEDEDEDDDDEDDEEEEEDNIRNNTEDDKVVVESGEEEEHNEEEEDAAPLNADQVLLDLLRHMRSLRMPVSTSGWEDTVASVNERLVRLVQARKNEKQGIDAERRAQNEQMARIDQERQTQMNTEHSLRDQVELLVDRCTALEHEKAALQAEVENARHLASQQQSPVVQVDDQASKALAGMLRESHEALISSNEMLREQLRETKEQYAADEEQWQRNFDHLRRTLGVSAASPQPVHHE
ncbi:Leucine-rich repeat-containing protein 36 [Hondaea fermentalgiana]|uniref:Leucine-rich repeat-containing protein 36 n=1 Tax=Hondaea fermentalgiana TaxID=2315210 RepID=A0A2R5GKT7_9STRA|nr:Leucine-rich repeat-containing protein 36 [Hondaea fermentalgiana]|eukprot:GBG28891.1 Leucine-rich repeat-containing protein 36 [Hondaea fermentalgiana]